MSRTDNLRNAQKRLNEYRAHGIKTSKERLDWAYGSDPVYRGNQKEAEGADKKTAILSAIDEAIQSLPVREPGTYGIGTASSTPYAPMLSTPEYLAQKIQQEKERGIEYREENLRKIQEARKQQEQERQLFENDLETISKMDDKEKELLEYASLPLDPSGASYPTDNMGRNAAMMDLIEKYGENNARRYTEAYRRNKNKQNTEKAIESGAKFAEDAHEKLGAVGTTVSSLLTVPVNIVSGIAGAIDYGGELINRGIDKLAGREIPYKTLDPNTEGLMGSKWSGAVRAEHKERISGGDDKTTWSKFLGVAYDAAMSAADSIARAAATGGISNLSLGIAGLGEFANSLSDASERGATPGQAAVYATTTALSEVLTEKIPLDRLIDTAKSGIPSIKKLVTSTLAQAGIEATTEEINLAVNLAADAAIMGDKSEYNRNIGDLISGGMSYEEAKRQAENKIWEQVRDTFNTSALSGLMMDVGAQAYGYATHGLQESTEQTKNVDQEVEQEVEQEVGASQEIQPDFDILSEIREDFSETGKITNRQAEAVLSDEYALETMVENVLKLPGTKAGNRQAVKDFLSGLFSEKEEQKNPVGPEIIADAIIDLNKKKNQVEQEPELSSIPEQLKNNGVRLTENQAEQLAMSSKILSDDIRETLSAKKPTVKSLESANIGVMGREISPESTVGAAESGFSPFIHMQNEYGNIPEGENPVRPDDMPVSTTGDDKVSYIARTIKGAEITPDDFVTPLEQKVVEGGMSYAPIKNSEAVQEAEKHIMQVGWDEALAQWRADVRDKKAGAELDATGALLLNNAAKAGDKTLWLDILSDFQTLSTNTAQGLQALRIIKKLAPSDKLYMIRRSVQQMVEDMNLDTEIKIDSGLAREYQEAQTEAEANRVLEEIQKDVASQIPSTAWDKWNALRYLNMLGNFKTQVRNVSGNVSMQAAYRVKDEIAAAIEFALDKATGGKFERTKSFTVNRGLKKAAANDFMDLENTVLDGGKFGDRNPSAKFAQAVQEQRKIFGTKVMESYRKLTDWAMNNEYFGDAGFAKSAYARAMAGYLKAHGVKGDSFEGVSQNLLDDARVYAIREAQEQTFHDNNVVSNWISKIGRRPDTPGAVKILSEGVMPFRKTPANVLVRAEEFSPLGIINSTVQSVRAAQGNVSGSEVVNSWAKSLTGTGLAMMGYFMARNGFLSGGPDEDDDQEQFNRMTGQQNYSLNLPGGYNLTIDFLSPAAMPLFLGAQMEKVLDGTDLKMQDVEKVFLSLADPMISMSMLQGINDTIDKLKFTDDNMGQFLLDSMAGYLTQGISNTLLGQLERGSEGERMTTYVDKDSQLSPWLQRQIGKWSAKTPGIDFQQMPYLDAWGRPQKNMGKAANTMYNLFSPSYVSKTEKNKLNDEINRLAKAQSGVNVFPKMADKSLNFTDKDGVHHKDYNLSQEEFYLLQTVQGQTAHDILENAVESDSYKSMTDSQRAKLFSMTYQYAREKGRLEAVQGYKELSDGWMREIKEGEELEGIAARVLQNDFASAFSQAKEAWKNGRENTGELIAAYEQYQNLPAREKERLGDSGQIGYMKAAADARIKADTFTELYGEYYKIQSQDTKPGNKATQWAHTLDKAQSSGKITSVQKKALSESMGFYSVMRSEATSYEKFTGEGVKPDLAKEFSQIISDLVPAPGESSVRTVDKIDAISDARATEKEKVNAISSLLSDSQQKKFNTMISAGYTTEEYGAAYRAYLDGEKKAGKIAEIARDTGVSMEEAGRLYRLFAGR